MFTGAQAVSRSVSRASVDNGLFRAISKKDFGLSQDFRSQGQRDPNQVMDNPRLASRSEIFVDDQGVKIIKRCYFLAIGDDDLTGNALQVIVSFNAFDEPAVIKKLEIRAKLTNVIVETCPEVLKSITQLIPEFKAMFRFKDLFPNKKKTARVIELFAPWHIIKENFISASFNQVSDSAILNEVNKWRGFRKQNQTVEQQKKLDTYKDRVTIKKLKGIDMQLKEIDFDIYFEIQKVGANITGN